MLEVSGVNVFYGQVQALFDVSLTVGDHEMISIIGANGAGKSTLMNTIAGLIKPAKGEITYDGKSISNFKPHKVVDEGIIYVPEGRHIFYDLTVEENLLMGSYRRKMTKAQYEEELVEVLRIFPRLKERMHQLAGTLSGGEQQMLAIGRGLMADPQLLMLDEPSLGLAPVIVDEMFDVIKMISDTKKIPIILVEQNAFMAMSITSRTYVLENGHVKYQGVSSELIKSPEIKVAYLGG